MVVVRARFRLDVPGVCSVKDAFGPCLRVRFGLRLL